MSVRLRAVTLAGLLVLCACAAGFAQDAAPKENSESEPTPTRSFFMARTGGTLSEPHIGTLHFLEFFQIRNRWIYPDLGYVDFAHGNYREFFMGGGRTLIENKIASWDQELLYVQATGPAAKSARYLQPWSMLRLRYTPKLRSEIVYFGYFPISDSAHIHHVIERAKLEYVLKKPWKVGAGYAGVKFPAVAWVNKPFLTTTISTRAGAFEFWLQRIPGGEQVEIRYALIHTSR